MAKNYRKTASGRFSVSIRQNGKAIYRTVDTELEAKQFIIDVQKTIKHLQAHPTDRSLRNILMQYLQHGDTKELKSFSQIELRANIIMLAHTWLTDLPIGNITVKDLEKFKSELKAKKLQPNTIKHYFSLLNQTFKHAIRVEQMPLTNIVGMVRLEKPRNERDRVLSLKEYEELLKVLPDWFEPIVSFAYYTAARQAEILKLKFLNVDFEKRTAMLLDTKNSEDRKIPLSKKAFAIIEKQKKTLEEKGEYKPEKTVFSGTKNSVSHGFKYYAGKAGLKNIVFHDLRHSAITLFLAPKVASVLMLQKITGHKTLSQLARYYNAKAEDLVEMLD